VLCARPDGGAMQRITSQSTGGAMLRRLLVPIVAVPFVLGWGGFLASPADWSDPPLAFTLFGVIVAVFVLLMMWRSARSIDEREVQRNRAEAQRPSGEAR